MVFKSRFADVKPDEKYKDLVSNFFWDKLDQFEASVLFVDYATRRHWTGAQIKTTSAKLAQQLIRHGLRANDDCVMFYKHCDYIQLAALGILFAGGSVCAGYDVDPEQEHAYMLAVMRPSFVFVGRNHVKEMVRLRTVDKHNYKIVVMDDDGGDQATSGMENGHDNGGAILGLHQDLLAEPEAGVVLADASPSLPVQVDPQRPAFTLLTSGSTGRPKPACRSQRNSLYVCHSLIGAKELWDLSESSVVAAHLALDHGTGIFQLKQCLTHGYKSIIINGYEMASMLDAIETYRITDLVLGSALVHNLLSSSELLLHERLGSLRNLLAVGSPIASQSTVRHFMSLLPECSVRQAFGMTETGFLCVVPRELALRNPDLDTQIVGLAMPNVEFKLVTRKRGSGPTTAATKTTTTTLTGNQSLEVNPEAKEITEFDEQGELYVRAPTVSPGYLGEQFREQSRANFLPDGFYKSNDICSIGSDGLLRVHGRFSEVLCLSDGWKVLPSEIEHTIMEHPFVREAAVVGIPHPTLPTCHAPRAYIVPRDGVAIDDDAIDDDAKQNGHDDGDHHQANGTNKLNGCVEQAKCCSNGHSNNNNSYKLQNHNNLDTKLNGTCPSKAISKRLIFDFVAERLSEPKHLIGGIKFMSELPKISIGKVDKRSLKRADGY